MKKTLFYSGLIVISTFIFFACSKKETLNQSTGPIPIPIPPPIPTLILKADTAWYNGSTTITITSNAQSIINLNTNLPVTGPVVITGLKSDSLVTFIAKNTSGNLTSTTTASITVRNHSERMTLWCNYGPYHNTYGQFCYMDSLQYTYAWHDIPRDCNIIEFFPSNGYARVTIGCGPNAGYIGIAPNAWAFHNNETIFFDQLQSWTIDYVNTLEWQAHKIVPVQGDPLNRSAKTVIRYSH